MAPGVFLGQRSYSVLDSNNGCSPLTFVKTHRVRDTKSET